PRGAMLECRATLPRLALACRHPTRARAAASMRPSSPRPKTGSMRVKTYSLLFSLLLLPVIGHAESKTIYGLNEHVAIPDFGLEVPAKLDTGAQTASLSARDIERFKRDGKAWVRFYLAIDEAHEHPIER